MNLVCHIESYAHAGRIGVLVECGLDTEFAARVYAPPSLVI